MESYEKYRTAAWIRRQERIAAGLCTRCGLENDRIGWGKRMCSYCALKIKYNDKARREAKKAAGLCPICGKKREDDGYILCPACREAQRKRNEKYRRKLAGIEESPDTDRM